MVDECGTSHTRNSDSDLRWSVEVLTSPNAKPQCMHCIAVKTVSPTRILLKNTVTKSEFCALHGLHEVLTELMRR